MKNPFKRYNDETSYFERLLLVWCFFGFIIAGANAVYSAITGGGYHTDTLFGWGFMLPGFLLWVSSDCNQPRRSK